MIYHSIADIFAANDEIRRRLVARVESLGGGHEARANGDAWSVAEIIEHLSLTERRVTRALETMLPQAVGALANDAKVSITNGDKVAGDAPQNFKPFSLDAYVEQSRDQKFEAPEFIRPHGIPLAAALAQLAESRAALEALRPRFECADHSAEFPHPAFGMLNVAQWLAFVGIHEARHLAQIERAVETMKSER
jgi:hypothetical protein